MTEVRTLPIKGRSLIATKNYSENDVILEEKPLISAQFSWNKTYKYLACDYCLFQLETAQENVRRLTFNPALVLPYPECDIVLSRKKSFVECPDCHAQYCSMECKLAADSLYHKSLCLGNDAENLDHPINAINEVWKKTHYPPETATVWLPLRILAMIKQAKDKQAIISSIQDFVGCPVSNEGSDKISHKILGEGFAQQLAKLREMFLKYFPADDPDIGTFLTKEGFQNLFTVIGMNSQGIGTSAFAEWVKKVSDLEIEDDKKENLDELIDDLYNNLEETAGQFLNNEGSGLFQLQSKINHSCDPNAEIRFPYSNHILHVVALKPITAGDEICISYLDACQIDRSRHSRQKHLMENYVFVCQCEKCAEQVNDPDETSEEEMDEEDDDMEDQDMKNLKIN